MAESDNHDIAVGELVMLSAGVYSGTYVTGIYRTREALDFGALAQEFVRTVPQDGSYEAPELPAVLMGENPRSEDPMERGFLAWLVDRGLIEPVPVVSVSLAGDLGNKHKFRSPRVSATVNLPALEPDSELRI